MLNRADLVTQLAFHRDPARVTVMTAKFTSTCALCSLPIAIGDQIGNPLDQEPVNGRNGGGIRNRFNGCWYCLSCALKTQAGARSDIVAAIAEIDVARSCGGG